MKREQIKRRTLNLEKVLALAGECLHATPVRMGNYPCKACYQKAHRKLPGRRDRTLAYNRKYRAENLELEKQRQKLWIINNREQRRAIDRNSNLRKLYGITTADYECLFASQSGKCAICGDAAGGKGNRASLHVDHEHSTGTIRGLLCGPCNVGIGSLRDRQDLLLKAVDYLKKHAHKTAGRCG